MLLEHSNAVVYGAGGLIGAAVARTFAREGARVFLAGRTPASLAAVAADIAAAGGVAEATQVDALDERAVEEHVAAVVAKAGSIDVSFNVIGIRGELQGTPLTAMSLEDFRLPIVTGATTHFLTARAAARRMVERGSGVILTLTASAGGLAGPLMGGFGVACAAIEGFTRNLAGELGPQGVRVVCLRSEGIPETWGDDDFTTHVFDPPGVGYGAGMNRAETLAHLESTTLLRRLPTLAELAETAAFLASDRAGAMTGAVANLTCGAIVD
jgi:NAD(P)-dependent dehydrogenase (short-subunit alcohol dehydrogenase family)